MHASRALDVKALWSKTYTQANSVLAGEQCWESSRTSPSPRESSRTIFKSLASALALRLVSLTPSLPASWMINRASVHNYAMKVGRAKDRHWCHNLKVGNLKKNPFSLSVSGPHLVNPVQVRPLMRWERIKWPITLVLEQKKNKAGRTIQIVWMMPW